MANYTTDQDLAVYVANTAALPESLHKLHTEAYSQIRRDLRAKGWTVAQLDALKATTLADLKVPSCHYVLYLHWRGQTHDPDGSFLARAKDELADYLRTLAATTIESDVASTSENASSGFGQVRLA